MPLINNGVLYPQQTPPVPLTSLHVATPRQNAGRPLFALSGHHTCTTCLLSEVTRTQVAMILSSASINSFFINSLALQFLPTALSEDPRHVAPKLILHSKLQETSMPTLIRCSAALHKAHVLFPTALHQCESSKWQSAVLRQ